MIKSIQILVGFNVPRVIIEPNYENIIFNITPSPGASTSLKNAENDAKTIVKFLGSGFKFNDKQFRTDLTAPPY